MITLPHPAAHFPGELVPRLLVLLVTILVMGFLASTYVGHSSSPYGTCYAASGRDIPCGVTTSGHSTRRPPRQR
jgi:hypothetical protein